MRKLAFYVSIALLLVLNTYYTSAYTLSNTDCSPTGTLITATAVRHSPIPATLAAAGVNGWDVEVTCNAGNIVDACQLISGPEAWQIEFWVYNCNAAGTTCVEVDNAWTSYQRTHKYRTTLYARSFPKIYCHSHYFGEDVLRQDSDSLKEWRKMCVEADAYNECDNSYGWGCATRSTSPYNSCSLSSATTCLSETGASACSDGIDNNCGGGTDCADSGCQSGPPCACSYHDSWCCSDIAGENYCSDRKNCPGGSGSNGVVKCSEVTVTEGNYQVVDLDVEYSTEASCTRGSGYKADGCDCTTAAQCPGGCIWTVNDNNGAPANGKGTIECLGSSVPNCNVVGHVGQPCDNAVGDRSGDDVADGFYCSNGYCCAEGYAYISGVCVDTAHGCYTNPCGETPLSSGWWSDSNCITVSGYCCRDGNLLGEPHYDYESATAY